MCPTCMGEFAGEKTGHALWNIADVGKMWEDTHPEVPNVRRKGTGVCLLVLDAQRRAGTSTRFGPATRFSS